MISLPNRLDREDRFHKMVEEKATLLLVLQLMGNLNPLPGLENMLRDMITGIMDTIGGTNVKVYYWEGTDLKFDDFSTRGKVIGAIDDPLAAQVAQQRRFLEESSAVSNTLLHDAALTEAYNWCFPLLVGGELIGVVKLENLHISAAALRLHLPVFFRHAALILSNEVRNLSRQKAEDQLAKYREHLEALVLERTEKLAVAVCNLERSNQDLEQFAYVASHDLQEPLRMIAAFTGLLEHRYESLFDDNAKTYMGFVTDGAARMQQLINDLLSYSRIGTSGVTPTFVDSNECLVNALRNLGASIEESGAVITQDPLPIVQMDSTQLPHVFQNLIGNAVKFRGPQTPRIHVAAENLGAEWRFSIKDNGIGIAPQYASRLFVIFQRLHTRQEYPGTGIGLVVCKRIVERHGGRIWFDSEPGQGTTFFFTVPKKTTPIAGS